jgi:hypothetical protein
MPTMESCRHNVFSMSCLSRPCLSGGWAIVTDFYCAKGMYVHLFSRGATTANNRKLIDGSADCLKPVIKYKKFHYFSTVSLLQYFVLWKLRQRNRHCRWSLFPYIYGITDQPGLPLVQLTLCGRPSDNLIGYWGCWIYVEKTGRRIQEMEAANKFWENWIFNTEPRGQESWLKQDKSKPSRN